MLTAVDIVSMRQKNRCHPLLKVVEYMVKVEGEVEMFAAEHNNANPFGRWPRLAFRPAV
jgi:hypothetical protein